MTDIKALANSEPDPEPKTPRRRGWRWVRRHLLPPYTGSSEDTVLGVPFYANPHYDRPWFQRTFGRAHSVLRSLDAAYYWVRYRCTRKGRYHIVYTDLKPGYNDVDEVMFRACFALLGRFVDGELGLIESADASAGHRGYRLHAAGGSDEAAIDLWLWYRRDLSAEEAEQDADYSGYVDRKGYNFLDDLKDKKLRALIDLRQTLWT